MKFFEQFSKSKLLRNKSCEKIIFIICKISLFGNTYLDYFKKSLLVDYTLVHLDDKFFEGNSLEPIFDKFHAAFNSLLLRKTKNLSGNSHSLTLVVRRKRMMLNKRVVSSVSIPSWIIGWHPGFLRNHQKIFYGMKPKVSVFLS